MPTRDEIRAAILEVTGDPDTGLVRDITPGIVDAIDNLCNPKPSKPKVERATVEVAETR